MFSVNIKGIDLVFETEGEVFSPAAPDRGTIAMLSVTDFEPDDRVLDLGCGWGLVGILASKLVDKPVIMCDVSGNAVELSKENAVRNGSSGDVDIRLSDAYENISERDFTVILSNPPYHTDFAVAKNFIEGGFRKLAIGGRMIMVTKRLDWYKNKLTSVFGGVKVNEVDGYYVFIAEKRDRIRADRKEKLKKAGAYGKGESSLKGESNLKGKGSLKGEISLNGENSRNRKLSKKLARKQASRKKQYHK